MADTDVDVVIVGAGVTGSVVARRLAAAGHSVMILEAGEATGTTWDGYQANVRQSLAATAKVPNAAWPNSPAAPSPNVLDIVKLEPDGPPGSNGYFVQNGPQPFLSDYARSRGGTTLHWYGHAIRMVPNDFAMKSVYGRASDWPLTYDDLSPWYDEAEREIGVAADVEEQRHFGVTFTPGYVYPMHPMPKSYLDQRLGAALEQATARVEGADYEVRVQAVPGGRNGIPNAAYDGGRGYVPVGAVGRPTEGLRCEGNSSCLPVCPVQAKYSALKTIAAAESLGVQVVSQAVVRKLERGPKGDIVALQYLRWSAGADPVPATVTAKIYVLAAHAIENAKLLLLSELATRSRQVGRNLMDHPFLLTWALAREDLGTFRGPGSTCGIESLRDGPFRHDVAAFRADIDNWGWSILGSPAVDVEDAVQTDGLFGEALRRRLAETVPRQLLLGFLLEQLPDEANRIELDARKDALGIPRPSLHYDIADYTQRGAVAARSVSKQVFDAMDVAFDATTYKPSANATFTVDGELYSVMGAGHVCGTHRMGTAAEESVVDADQRCWEHPNLFVVGCGSMRTIGTSNPTLTATALACRTAAAIADELGAT